MPKLSRRDFLKLSFLLPASLAGSRLASRWPRPRFSQPRPNVLILILDAMSARNLSLYNYARDTTPNINRFASRATVYHNHHSAGNFTVPGTASLLTGLYPWTHRAINMAGLINRALSDQNLFRTFGGDYHRLAFSQNLWANQVFNQFSSDIETILPPDSFSVASQVAGDLFKGDLNAAYRTYDDFLFQDEDPPGSLLFGLQERLAYNRKTSRLHTQAQDYPTGMPQTGLLPIFFRLDHLFQGLGESLSRLPTPFLAYCHLWCVHEPYRPHQDFFDVFEDDGFTPPEKPMHPLGGKFPQKTLRNRRVLYDEYIASVDQQFGRLIDSLERFGLLEQTILVLTSDHGESFERGTLRHITPLLFEPLVHIPLIIRTPGQAEGVNVLDPTNSVDVLPTLAHLAGREIPGWCEGQLLPGLGGSYDPRRSTFSVEAKSNPAYEALRTVSIAMQQDRYKLTYYTAADYDFFELYDLENDPEELTNLLESRPDLAGRMQSELLANLNRINQPYLDRRFK